ncbi:HAD family phosphatase [Streptomyces sp. NBC_00885]|uniref:HAD family hydrolase n=1 Tax=Streptomyces sp. NBC_00885 TaxID=2975857 RepID=UPI003868F30A|nr:HAD family phosphatase [Streptomyces sp. NBC_00885]
MIKPIELVIFDCDGVLVDSERIAARVQVTLGAELGWPLTEDEVVDRFIGRSSASIREQVSARLGHEAAAIWWERFEQLHHDAVDAGLSPVEGLPEALDAAPDLFLYAAEKMGVDPAACVVVEDSRPGVQAARAAGMRAFGYAGGLTPAERLEGADTVVFHDMRKLPNLIAEQ